MNKEGEESFLSIYLTRNVLKRQILIDSIDFIVICRSLFISFDDMPNAHIRGCYCMVRETCSDFRVFLLIFYKPRVVPVLILFYGSGFVASPASRWTGRCFDKVLCLVNVDDKNLDS